MKHITEITAWVAMVVLTACTGSLPDDGNPSPEEKGEPVLLSFDMYGATVTKASENSTVAMLPETKFTIYAFPKGTTDLSKPLASGIYTIGNDNKATGNMSLYRGEYDMYLLSNNTNIAPVLSADGVITVDNGTDFMYNTLTGFTVQPEKTGENVMNVTLPAPFVRLGSQVRLAVKAKQSPVTVTDLKVQSITMYYLSSPLSYKLGATDWENGGTYAKKDSIVVTSFDNTPGHTEAHLADPVVVLPVSGSTPIEFKIVLDVTYVEKVGDTTTYPTKTFIYSASSRKTLLSGMVYGFEFTLTFFGVLSPGDITIGLLDYTNQDLPMDEVGE